MLRPTSLTVGPPLKPDALRDVRTRMAMDHCKWDLQIGDRFALCPQPLLLQRAIWEQLAGWSERMAAEITAAEEELASRPELHGKLGLPRSLRAVMRRGLRDGFTPCAARVMRFDFHLTTDGWRVSEVNSDVPGGFAEASAFTRMMAAHYASATMSGDPLAAWTAAMLAALQEERIVALLSAPGYMEDQQVTASLGEALRERSVTTRLLHRPEQIVWRSGRAYSQSKPLGAIVRFFQAEWICGFRTRHWEQLFIAGETPVSNHALAALTESKRLSLLWDRLQTKLPVCRSLFPAAADPRDAALASDDSWVVKRAYSNTGDAVLMRERMGDDEWKALAKEVRRRSIGWVLQRRFDPAPIRSDLGMLFPCIGIYVIAGRAAGSYTRVATEKIVDYRAMDAALLITEQ